MRAARIRTAIAIALFSIVPTLVLWIPFYLQLPSVVGIPLARGGMQTVAANYDGPLYIVIAKSLYNKDIILNSFPFTLPYEYYAAHFPLFPILIRLVAVVSGFPWGMLIVTLLTSYFALVYFYKLAKAYVTPERAMWLTLVFSLFPARFLIVRSVGSPEPLFIGAIIAALFYFKKKNYLLAGIFGAVAQLTKSPGVLLFAAMCLAVFIPRFHSLAVTNSISKWVKSLHWQIIFIALIPLSLLGLFYFYQTTFGSFLAYFNSGDNIHLFFPPFQIFNYSQPWVNTHWLEEIIFIYLIGAIGSIRLMRQKDWALGCFTIIFFITTLFVSHRDMLRYSLPIVPFLIIAFREELAKREVQIAALVILVPIFLYAFAFISNNVMPIPNWGPLL